MAAAVAHGAPPGGAGRALPAPLGAVAHAAPSPMPRSLSASLESELRLVTGLWERTSAELAQARMELRSTQAVADEIIEGLALQLDAVEEEIEVAAAGTRAGGADGGGAGGAGVGNAGGRAPGPLPQSVRTAPPMLRSVLQRAWASGTASPAQLTAAADELSALQRRLKDLEGVNAALKRKVAAEAGANAGAAAAKIDAAIERNVGGITTGDGAPAGSERGPAMASMRKTLVAAAGGQPSPPPPPVQQLLASRQSQHLQQPQQPQQPPRDPVPYPPPVLQSAQETHTRVDVHFDPRAPRSHVAAPHVPAPSLSPPQQAQAQAPFDPRHPAPANKAAAAAPPRPTTPAAGFRSPMPTPPSAVSAAVAARPCPPPTPQRLVASVAPAPVPTPRAVAAPRWTATGPHAAAPQAPTAASLPTSPPSSASASLLSATQPSAAAGKSGAQKRQQQRLGSARWEKF